MLTTLEESLIAGFCIAAIIIIIFTIVVIALLITKCQCIGKLKPMSETSSMSLNAAKVTSSIAEMSSTTTTMTTVMTPEARHNKVRPAKRLFTKSEQRAAITDASSVCSTSLVFPKMNNQYHSSGIMGRPSVWTSAYLPPPASSSSPPSSMLLQLNNGIQQPATTLPAQPRIREEEGRRNFSSSLHPSQLASVSMNYDPFIAKAQHVAHSGSSLNYQSSQQQMHGSNAFNNLFESQNSVTEQSASYYDDVSNVVSHQYGYGGNSVTSVNADSEYVWSSEDGRPLSGRYTSDGRRYDEHNETFERSISSAVNGNDHQRRLHNDGTVVVEAVVESASPRRLHSYPHHDEKNTIKDAFQFLEEFDE